MPNAVTHVIVAIVLIDLVRDYIFKKKHFPLYLVLIGGIFGLIPDIDVLISWVIGDLGIHRLFTHNFVIPALFLIIGLGLWYFRKNSKLKITSKILFVMAAGFTIHVLLDLFLSGTVYPLWPFWDLGYGLGLLSMTKFGGTVYAGLDAIILVVWLVHEYVRHNIRDYI